MATMVSPITSSGTPKAMARWVAPFTSNSAPKTTANNPVAMMPHMLIVRRWMILHFSASSRCISVMGVLAVVVVPDGKSDVGQKNCKH